MWWVLLFCQVQTGADELAQSGFERLKGLKYGLICNHTAVDRNGTHLLRLLEQADCPPQIIFTPEHGFSGLADRPIEGQQTSDPIQLVSLYGKEKKPSVEQLAGLDCLVFDIQDIGTRFYTYVSTMSQCLEAAAEAKIPMIILDRPNPLGGLLLDGPLPDRQ